MKYQLKFEGKDITLSGPHPQYSTIEGIRKQIKEHDSKTGLVYACGYCNGSDSLRVFSIPFVK